MTRKQTRYQLPETDERPRRHPRPHRTGFVLITLVIVACIGAVLGGRTLVADSRQCRRPTR